MATCPAFYVAALSISLDVAYGAAQRCRLLAEHRYDVPFCNYDKSF